MSRGRKKLSSEALRANGAKKHRVMARLAEEHRAALPPAPVAPAPVEFAPDPESLAEFLAAIAKENSTFQARQVPGQTVVKEHGAEFNWRRPHYLTIVRSLASDVVSGKTQAEQFTKRVCARFLRNLDTGAKHGFYMDPVAVTNIGHYFSTFGEKDFEKPLLLLLSLVQFFGWKLANGENRLADRWLLVFDPIITKVLDGGFRALAAAV